MLESYEETVKALPEIESVLGRSAVMSISIAYTYDTPAGRGGEGMGGNVGGGGSDVSVSVRHTYRHMAMGMVDGRVVYTVVEIGGGGGGGVTLIRSHSCVGDGPISKVLLILPASNPATSRERGGVWRYKFSKKKKSKKNKSSSSPLRPRNFPRERMSVAVHIL